MQRFAFGTSRFGGEAAFAPRSHIGNQQAAAEDDGYLITFVYDENSGASECVIVDAQHLSDGPLACIFIPHRVPYGFHAGWVPG